MDDKFYLESLLSEVKNLCTISFFGTVESSNEWVRQKLQTSLNVFLEMQNTIYQHMASLGFYQVENVDQHVLNQEKTKIEPLNLNYNDPCYTNACR